MNYIMSSCKPIENEYNYVGQTSEKFDQGNILLLIFDLLMLPITLIRVILIYLWGSKYCVKGFRFLDVIMHADNAYFNQEDCRIIDTIGTDYRVAIRDDSRLYPIDLEYYLKCTKNDVVIGSTISNESDSNNVAKKANSEQKSIWNMDTEVLLDDLKRKKREKLKNLLNCSDNVEEESFSENEEDDDEEEEDEEDEQNENDIEERSNENIKKKDIPYLSVGTDKDVKGVNYFGEDGEHDTHQHADNEMNHLQTVLNKRVDYEIENSKQMVDSAMRDLISCLTD